MTGLDKNEFKMKLEEIDALAGRGDFEGAAKVADTLDWRRVKNIRTLLTVAEIYEAVKHYQDSLAMLQLAYRRAGSSKSVVYRLAEMYIRLGDYDNAERYIREFKQLSPHDMSRYILLYKLARAQKAPLDDQIALLKAYKNREYTERWAFELARLYHQNGQDERCVEECDDMILWFSQGKYVMRAMELKMQIQPLSEEQEKQYKSEKERIRREAEAAEAARLEAERKAREEAEERARKEREEAEERERKAREEAEERARKEREEAEERERLAREEAEARARELEQQQRREAVLREAEELERVTPGSTLRAIDKLDAAADQAVVETSLEANAPKVAVLARQMYMDEPPTKEQQMLASSIREVFADIRGTTNADGDDAEMPDPALDELFAETNSTFAEEVQNGEYTRMGETAAEDEVLEVKEPPKVDEIAPGETLAEAVAAALAAGAAVAAGSAVEAAADGAAVADISGSSGEGKAFSEAVTVPEETLAGVFEVLAEKAELRTVEEDEEVAEGSAPEEAGSDSETGEVSGSLEAPEGFVPEKVCSNSETEEVSGSMEAPVEDRMEETPMSEADRPEMAEEAAAAETVEAAAMQDIATETVASAAEVPEVASETFASVSEAPEKAAETVALAAEAPEAVASAGEAAETVASAAEAPEVPTEVVIEEAVEKAAGEEQTEASKPSDIVPGVAWAAAALGATAAVATAATVVTAKAATVAATSVGHGVAAIPDGLGALAGDAAEAGASAVALGELIPEMTDEALTGEDLDAQEAELLQELLKPLDEEDTSKMVALGADTELEGTATVMAPAETPETMALEETEATTAQAETAETMASAETEAATAQTETAETMASTETEAATAQTETAETMASTETEATTAPEETAATMAQAGIAETLVPVETASKKPLVETEDLSTEDVLSWAALGTLENTEMAEDEFDFLAWETIDLSDGEAGTEEAAKGKALAEESVEGEASVEESVEEKASAEESLEGKDEVAESMGADGLAATAAEDGASAAMEAGTLAAAASVEEEPAKANVAGGLLAAGAVAGVVLGGAATVVGVAASTAGKAAVGLGTGLAGAAAAETAADAAGASAVAAAAETATDTAGASAVATGAGLAGAAAVAAAAGAADAATEEDLPFTFFGTTDKTLESMQKSERKLRDSGSSGFGEGDEPVVGAAETAFAEDAQPLAGEEVPVKGAAAGETERTGDEGAEAAEGIRVTVPEAAEASEGTEANALVEAAAATGATGVEGTEANTPEAAEAAVAAEATGNETVGAAALAGGAAVALGAAAAFADTSANAPAEEAVKTVASEEPAEPAAAHLPEEEDILAANGFSFVPIGGEEEDLGDTKTEEETFVVQNRRPLEPRPLDSVEVDLLSYFSRIPGIPEQVTVAMADVYNHSGERTSNRGNVLIMGRPGSGKTRLAQGMILAMGRDLGIEAVKSARLTAQEMNQKDAATVIHKMAGGFLVIEAAGALRDDVIEQMSEAMEFRTDDLVIILEDERRELKAMLGRHPIFAEKFTSEVVVPVFTNDELVMFAKTYAKERGYKLDEMAVLALYTEIGENQRDEEPVTVGMVRMMVDRAINRTASHRFGRRRSIDTDGRIILREKDFDY